VTLAGPRQLVAAWVVAALVGLVACRTTTELTAVSPDELEQAMDELEAPLPGDVMALYRLRARLSGNLRLSLQTRGAAGRLSISEPFGSALSLGAWDDASSLELADLKQGCRVLVRDLSSLLGGSGLPMPQAVRLLGGKLPAVATDQRTLLSEGRVLITGQGWAAVVTVQPSPWRVVAVSSPPQDVVRWRVDLTAHQGSVPGAVRFEHSSGSWAELTLIRLEWRTPERLPRIPELPWCE